MSIATEYRRLDALGDLATNQTITAAAYQDESRQDFKKPGGCPHVAAIISLNSITTAKTIDVQVHESSDDSSYAEVTNPVRLVGLGTVGKYLLLLNNKIVQKQYMKLYFNPTALFTGASANVDAYLVPLTGLA